jgi:predicted transcriptional regulator
MSKTVTLTLPEDVEAALDDVTRQEGLPASQVVTEAIKEYLFLRRLRLLRDSMTSQAAAIGMRTDQDVFDRVS